MNKKYNSDQKLFNVLSYALVTPFALICVIPFILILSGSLSTESLILRTGYGLIPKGFTISAYEMVFKIPQDIFNAYGVTIGLTVTGTLLGLFFISMTAYVLLRKSFRSRNFFAMFFYFTTLFSGGLVPWYILMLRYLNMRNSYLALLLPVLFSVFDLIIMRTYMKSIPDSLCESAIIDGANEFIIYTRIYLPLCKPVLATIGLFIALRYWNDWYNAMLFISDETMHPLQYYLYRTLNTMQTARMAAERAGVPIIEMPSQTFRLAMTVVATGPIIFLYPFLQRYFIRGITIGAVKG
jgi:putative aldouronate transport system permease protein